MSRKKSFDEKLEESSGMMMHFAFEPGDDPSMMSELLHRFLCEACHAEFDSAGELDEHQVRLLEPQPTLPG